LANLTRDPMGWELEDFAAAHFVSRGCFVETGIKERTPDEILELDIVWTDYRIDRPSPHPVEVKSGGNWGLGDVFKFYGWTQYLGLQPGQFMHKEPCGRLSPSSLKHVSDRTGISFLHVPKPTDAETLLKALGLREPPWQGLPEIWRFSFWAQRRLLKALSKAIEVGVCVESAKAAKEYHQLINDAVFFIRDIRDRVGALLEAHFEHQHLGATAAHEIESGKFEVKGPPQTRVFKKALIDGDFFPVQASLYLAQRARLYILKALVDYWLSGGRSEPQAGVVPTLSGAMRVAPPKLSNAMTTGLNDLSGAKSFRMFPTFWQVFLWNWGGFLLKDRLDKEYSEIAAETGVPVEEIPLALTAFDRLFPIDKGWFREPSDDSRRVLTLMPATMRGIGSFRRLMHEGKENYSDLDFRDDTARRMAGDQNACARLLDCKDEDLVK